MAGYQPLKITGFETGLVQERQEFLLPDDAYPVLQNAYVWREKLLRKKGFQLLGRLQRNITLLGPMSAGTVDWAFPSVTFNIFQKLGLNVLEPNASITPGTATVPFTINIGAVVLSDTLGQGYFNSISTYFPSATINYATGDITLFTTVISFGTVAITLTSFSYAPGLPVMGIRIRELQNSSIDQTIFFDQRYAYIYNSTTASFQEWIPGTVWNAHLGDVYATDFFWSTNYWVSQTTIPGTATPLFGTTNTKLFWETNNTGQFHANQDPPRISDGSTWVNFFPSVWSQIDATNFLVNFLCMLPFRGRLVTFNTWEGPNAAGSLQFSNRIRWSRIGNPFIPYSAGPPATGSWRDDIRGQGGFLDIPTSEDIVSVGFVRDNLVIYCERSTWQLRYTGRTIAPFQIERVNSELGTESTFSSVQFDTSLVGMGDKGIVECDSYKSNRIDIKIPDFVFQFNIGNNSVQRVQGIRDFPNRLSYWTVCLAQQYDPRIPRANWAYPNTRLVYNYENDSWALFNDSLTTLGNYQAQTYRTWLNTPLTWLQCAFSWIDRTEEDPLIVGGNQQGFIEILDQQTTNGVSLFIANITGNDTAPTVITSPNHNLNSDFVIQISGIPIGTPFANLNGGVFSIILGDLTGADTTNSFSLYVYNPSSMQFSTPQVDPSGQVYVGSGYISIRENFSIKSKKFNFLDEGQNIQMGYLDILMSSSENSNPGEISLNVYLDYDDANISNTLPDNEINSGISPPIADKFFNSTIPTTQSSLSSIVGSKFWQRVYCATRASFLTLQYTFSNAQMAGGAQRLPVQIDAQILWIRKAGRMTSI